MKAPLIDTHCHLTHTRFERDLDAVVARAVEAGLAACVTIGTGVADARRVADLARRHAGFVHCTAGIDPFSAHAAGGGFAAQLDELRALLGGGGYSAVGEIGLDGHYDLDPMPLQIERFEVQLDLAREFDLPVVVHVREAHEEMATTLERHPGIRGVIHSFTAGPREAERYLALGWHLAFNGVLTFKGAPAVREAARLAPVDRLLVETDAPYLAPVPLRGQRCEPAHVAHTLARLAEVREMSADELADATSRNARHLFGLDG